MRKLLYLSLIISAPLMAESETRVDNVKDRLGFSSLEHTGGYFSPSVQQTEIKGSDVYQAGLKLAAILNDSFLLGGTGAMIASRYDVAPQRRLDMSYGGLYAGYNLFPRNIINVTVGAGYSWGSLKIDRAPDEAGPSFDRNKIQVIEPEVMVDLNLTSSLRVGAGVAFRKVKGVEHELLAQDDLDGQMFLASVTLKEH